MDIPYALYVKKRLEEALMSPEEKKKEIIREIVQEIDMAIDEIHKWYEMEFSEGYDA